MRKIALDGGFDCPNRDGTVGSSGCLFCDELGGSGRAEAQAAGIRQQLATRIDELAQRRPRQRYIAYFQSFTNTHAPVARLERLFEAALEHPMVAGLAVGTRPDCLPPPVLALLERLARRAWVTVELGVQTLHDETLRTIRRGHDAAASLAAVRACRQRGIFVCAHLILGLPGEGPGHWETTARRLAGTNIDAVKVHNLYVGEGSPLARAWEEGRLPLLTLDEYVDGVVRVLERLPPHTVIERLNSDPALERLIAPAWTMDKAGIVLAIRELLEERDTRQGRLFAAAE